MEFLFVMALAAVGIFAYFMLRGNPDKNQDGKIDLQDAKATVEEVKTAAAEVVKPLDVNQDGKVDVQDVKEVVKRGRKKASETTKKVVEKAKTAAVKPRTPRSKKVQ